MAECKYCNRLATKQCIACKAHMCSEHETTTGFVRSDDNDNIIGYNCYKCGTEIGYKFYKMFGKQWLDSINGEIE